MIKSILTFSTLFLSVVFVILFTLNLPTLNLIKNIICTSVLYSVLIYISYNVANYIWSKLPPIIKEKVIPTGKAVFITGCDTGFGHELAKKLHLFGFKVYAGVLNDKSPGALALHQFSNNKITTVNVNVTLDEQVLQARKVVEEDIRKNNYKLYAIVNNAGILVSTEIEMGSMEPFVNQIDVNLLGVIRVTKAFLPLLRETASSDQSLGSKVVNVASLAGRFSIPGMVGYCVSKCGVISFSEGLRREMKKWNIDVITIEPHLFNTNLVNNEVNHRLLNKAWDETPSDIKEAYGDCYFTGYQRFLNKVLGSARPRVGQVVETMYTAVTEQLVSPSYLVLGDIEALRIWMWTFWPTRALDYLSYYAAILQTGEPAIKLKAIYDKKKRG